MALQAASPPSTPSPQIVGNAFVEQYYQILHQSPESVYRFYQESSIISRPDSDGAMTSVTTVQGINEKILSFNYKDFKAEIRTANAQKSYKDGVMVVVTGILMGKDNFKRNFTQSFFLAPQNIGFFVLNDVFCYVEDNEPLKSNPGIQIDDSPAAPLTPEPEPECPRVSDLPTPDSTISLVEDNQIVSENTQDILENEVQIAIDEVDLVESLSNTNGKSVPSVAEYSSTALEDTPKKSYASILSAQTITSHPQAMKGNVGQNKVYVPAKTLRMAPTNTEKQSSISVAPTPVPETSGTSSISSHENNNSHDEVEGHSIYVRNLPFTVNVSDLEAAFEKFGPIKKEGIQVRNHQHVGHCFGFVEFQSASSMEAAIQASPVTVGGREAVVEIKKTSSRVGDMRSRYQSGRGGYRNGGYRSQGNFGGGRSFGRNGFSGRGRGSMGRNGEGYHQQGSGGGSRPITPNMNDNAHA